MTTATALTLATYFSLVHKAKSNATALTRVAELTGSISPEAFNAAVISTATVAIGKTLAAMRTYTEALEKLQAELKKDEGSPDISELTTKQIREGAPNVAGNVIMLEFLVAQLAELIDDQEAKTSRDKMRDALDKLAKQAEEKFGKGDGENPGGAFGAMILDAVLKMKSAADCDGDPNEPGPHHAKDCPMYRGAAPSEPATEPAQAAAE